MGTIHQLIPRLLINRPFTADFLAVEAPCFAMGIVEERKTPIPYLVLRTAEDFPSKIIPDDFKFDYFVLCYPEHEVILFSFEFCGFCHYSALVNPNNPNARTILKLMIEKGEFFFSANSLGGSTIGFKVSVPQDNQDEVLPHLDRLMASKTTDSQYDRAVASYAEIPEATRTLLNWVCRDKAEYLDMTRNTFVLDPPRDHDQGPTKL